MQVNWSLRSRSLPLLAPFSQASLLTCHQYFVPRESQRLPSDDCSFFSAAHTECACVLELSRVGAIALRNTSREKERSPGLSEESIVAFSASILLCVREGHIAGVEVSTEDLLQRRCVPKRSHIKPPCAHAIWVYIFDNMPCFPRELSGSLRLADCVLPRVFLARHPQDQRVSKPNSLPQRGPDKQRSCKMRAGYFVSVCHVCAQQGCA
jgi:hypothetical protein